MLRPCSQAARARRRPRPSPWSPMPSWCAARSRPATAGSPTCSTPPSMTSWSSSRPHSTSSARPGVAIQSDFAQVNLGAVLFGVADEPVEPAPELRVPKVSQRALIAVPPFTITGHIHLMPGARPARSARRADGPVHPGHRRRLLVRPGRRSADLGPRRGRQSLPRPDPGAASRGRSVGRPRSRAGDGPRARPPVLGPTGDPTGSRRTGPRPGRTTTARRDGPG